MKIFSIFFFFLLLFLFSIKVEAKDYDGNNFICADEIGPILEFPVPKLVGNNTKKKGFVTYDNYWNLKLSKKLKSKHGEFDLIYSANTLTHISNLKEVFISIKHLLSKNGILIIEDPSLIECLKKTSYDQFYNEHIYLLSAISLKNILKEFNLEIFDIKKLKTHGGSLRYYIKRKNNKKFNQTLRLKDQFKREIDEKIREPKLPNHNFKKPPN